MVGGRGSDFHNASKVRHNQNIIELIKAKGGQLVTNVEDIQIEVIFFFKKLLVAKGASDIRDMNSLLDNIPWLVKDEDNLMLMAPTTKQEVKCVALQLHPDKTPGPDGFLACFTTSVGI